MTLWVLSSAQFSALWAATGQDRIPYPFRISSALDDSDEYEAEQNAIRAEFSGYEHEELAGALSMIAEPEVRIEISGSQGEGPGSPVRMIGSIARRHAVVALQHPGPEAHVGGDVAIRICEPDELVRQMISQIPAIEGGSMRGLTFQRDALAPAGLAVLRRPDAVSRGRAIAEILDRPSVGGGIATVRVGARHCEERIGGVSWRDIDGDGRYLISGDDTISVQPGNSWDLIAVLNRLSTTVAVR